MNQKKKKLFVRNHFGCSLHQLKRHSCRLQMFSNNIISIIGAIWSEEERKRFGETKISRRKCSKRKLTKYLYNISKVGNKSQCNWLENIFIKFQAHTTTTKRTISCMQHMIVVMVCTKMPSNTRQYFDRIELMIRRWWWSWWYLMVEPEK